MMKLIADKNQIINKSSCKIAEKKQGFTLIELSVVLVIVGLVVGGIMVGQELIYTARIRQMGTELQKIETAITTFRVKYECLPGDCAIATNFWGTNSAGCPAGGGLTGTCNGNGDGAINGWFTANLEHLYAWQQLSFAGLIPWSFKGTAITGGPTYTPLIVGTNIPASAFNQNIGYNLYTVRAGIVTAWKTTLEIGAVGSSNADVLAGAGLTGPDAQKLDTKFDDGLPESGKIFAVSGGSIIVAYNQVTTNAIQL